MPATSYDYVVADFPAGIHVDGFIEEIRDSTILIALSYIDVEAPDVHVWFKDTLSGGDQTTLDALVAAHDGLPPDGASALTIAINEDSDRTITGRQSWDRSVGGILAPPSGTVFPGSPIAKEMFWRVDEMQLYRRNDGNTAWVALTATTAGVKAGTIIPGGFSGNPKTASVTFGFPFADATYAISTAVRTDASRTFALSVTTKTSGGFVVSLNANNVAGLVEVGWTAIASGG